MIDRFDDFFKRHDIKDSNLDSLKPNKNHLSKDNSRNNEDLR